MARRARFRGRRHSSFRRALELLGVFAVLSGVALAAVMLDEYSMQALAGIPRAVDGDTLAFEGRRVRLAGIDAPELRQTCRRADGDYACGQVSRRYLENLLGAGQTECRGNEEDRYGRLLVRCVSATTDINSAMVRAGWAVSYGGYHLEELAARDAHAGLWAGRFERPHDWRVRHGAIVDLGPAGMARRLVNRIMPPAGMRAAKEE